MKHSIIGKILSIICQGLLTSLYVKFIGITAEARRDYIIVTKNSQDPGIQSAGEAIIIIETAV